MFKYLQTQVRYVEITKSFFVKSRVNAQKGFRDEKSRR